MSTLTRRISRLQLVVVPSGDQEKSVAFYESLGFEKRADAPFGAGRWIEVYLPSGDGDLIAGLAIAPAAEGTGPVETGIILNTDDIGATHEELRAGGLDVDTEIARAGSSTRIRIAGTELAEPDPPMFYVRDPDGNSLLIVEPGN